MALGKLTGIYTFGETADNLPSVLRATAGCGDLYIHLDNVFESDPNAPWTYDEYTVVWFKDGVRVTSGITNTTIQVINRADGSDLIAEGTSMTEIGSTGSQKYTEATNKITAGEAVLMIVSATIDGGTRSFARTTSRDSSA